MNALRRVSLLATLAALVVVVPSQSLAVVHVFVEVKGTPDFKIERPGSGVVIDASGLVVTHASLVAEGANAPDKQIFVQLADAARTRLPAHLVATRDIPALALLRVEPPTGITLTAAALSDDPLPGTPAMVLSFHDGEDHVAFAGVTSRAQASTRVTAGAKPAELPRADILLTDAAIQARSHGAALLDHSGALLGLCSAMWVQPDVREPTLDDLKKPSFGFVLPARVLRRAFADDLRGLPAATPTPPTPEARATNLAAPAIVAVYAGKAARPLLDGGDPYATTRRPGVGSGVVVSKDGLVLTSLHLVEKADAISLTWLDGTSLPAELVRGHFGTNTALLRARLPAGKTLTPIPFASGEPAVGATLLALGNPEGHTLAVGRGVFSALRGGRLQTDAPLGNHTGGGALVDLSGAMVALLDAGRTDAIDIAWAQRGDRAKLDTSLNLTPAIATLRAVYAAELGETAAKAAPPPASPVAEVIARVGGAVLNIFIEASGAPAELDDNPFAQPSTATTILGLGSGVVIDARGIALTNWHVVDEATFPDGSMRDGRVLRATRRDGRSFPLRVLSISREEDLALVQLEVPAGERLDAIELGSSAALRVGDPTIAVGNPHGRANTVTAGVVTAKNQSIRVRGRWAKLPHLLETDAAINGGNSGGPLLDGAGRLIGINSAGGDLRAVTGYAIGIDHVREKLAGLLLSPEKLRSPYLGFAVIEAAGKLTVASVDRDGPAAEAGLLTGDVVHALDTTKTPAQLDFALAMVDLAPDREVRVAFVRDGATRAAKITPWPAAIWAVFQQTRLLVSATDLRRDRDRVHAAALAAHRHRTGDPASAPTTLPTRAVRIDRVHGALGAAGVDVRAGDLLLGARLRSVTPTGDAVTYVTFETPDDLQRCCNANSTYEGSSLTMLVHRESGVVEIALPVRRLML